MSGDRPEDDDMDRPPEGEPRDEPRGGGRDPPREDEPRGGGRQPRDDRPPADEPRGGRQEPRGGQRAPRRTGPGPMDILKRQENMTMLKTYGALYTLVGALVGIGAILVYNIGGVSRGSGVAQVSTPSPLGPVMIGGLLAFAPLLAVLIGREVYSDLDQDTRSSYITAGAVSGVGALGMTLIGGLFGFLGMRSLSGAGVLVGAIVITLISAAVGALTIWISDWAERSSQPMRRPAGGRQGEARGDRRDDRQPR